MKRVVHAPWCGCTPCVVTREMIAFTEEMRGRAAALFESSGRSVKPPNRRPKHARAGSATALAWRYGSRKRSA